MELKNRIYVYYLLKMILHWKKKVNQSSSFCCITRARIVLQLFSKIIVFPSLWLIDSNTDRVFTVHISVFINNRNILANSVNKAKINFISTISFKYHITYMHKVTLENLEESILCMQTKIDDNLANSSTCKFHSSVAPPAKRDHTYWTVYKKSSVIHQLCCTISCMNKKHTKQYICML